MDECLFCRIVAGEVPANIVFEDETVVAFSDIAPQAPLHVLVVPRRHIRNAAAVTPDDADVVAVTVGEPEPVPVTVAEADGVCAPAGALARTSSSRKRTRRRGAARETGARMLRVVNCATTTLPFS